MPLCNRCRQQEATRGFIHRVNGEEKVNADLCEDCARPVLARLKAKRQVQQKCDFCGGAAFNPLPGVPEIIYACCRCRAEYARILFEFCARQRPELLRRSKMDIFYFDTSFDPEVEAWSAATSRDAIAQLRRNKPDDGVKPS